MALPVYVYHPEHGKSKYPVYPADLSAWFDHGWTTDPPKVKLTVVESEPDPISSPPISDAQTAKEYEAELISLYKANSQGWRDIAKIAAALGVERHADGWEETIPAIVDKKFPRK